MFSLNYKFLPLSCFTKSETGDRQTDGRTDGRGATLNPPLGMV